MTIDKYHTSVHPLFSKRSIVYFSFYMLQMVLYFIIMVFVLLVDCNLCSNYTEWINGLLGSQLHI